jgi:hypothetical protein
VDTSARGRLARSAGGRDVLIGAAGGAVMALMPRTHMIVTNGLGFRFPVLLEGLNSTPEFIARLVDILPLTLFVSLAFLFLFFLFGGLTRRMWIGFVAAILLMALPDLISVAFNTATPWSVTAAGLVMYAFTLWILIRFGLTALVVLWSVYQIFLRFPMTFDPSVWYAGYGYVGLGILAVIVAYALRTSLGDRRIFELAD